MMIKEVVFVIGLAIGYLMIFMIGLLHDEPENRKGLIGNIRLGCAALFLLFVCMRVGVLALVFSFISVFFIGLMFHVSDARKGHIRNVVRVCTVLIWSILIYNIYNR